MGLPQAVTASVLLTPSGRRKPCPACPRGALAQQTSATTRVSEQLSQEDESVIITLSLAGICREVVPWKRKPVLWCLKGKLNLFVKGDTGGQAGTGWGSFLSASPSN